MPISKKNKHRSVKVRKAKPIAYTPTYTSGLSDNLRAALKAKLDLKELVDLEQQLQMILEQERRKAKEQTHRTTWAVVIRVLHDRFGFEADDKRTLYDTSLEYLTDIGEGRLTLREMLDTLENEDGIRLSWEDNDGNA